MTDSTIREQIFPQLTAYDKMPAGRIVPFGMLAGPVGHRSEVVNTDAHGFRWTRARGQIWTTEKIMGLKNVSIVVGGSTAFGVGSSRDATTIASYLAEAQGSPWLNLGVRGGVSFQELIHTLRFLHQFESVSTLLLFSGVNDAYINILHDYDAEFDRRFEEKNSLLGFYDWRRQALSSIMAAVSRFDPEDLVCEPIGRMLSAPFRRPQGRAVLPRLNFEQKIGKIYQLARRNFLAYSALSRQLGARLVFVLQPFLSWTGKSLSKEEGQVMEFLLEQQKNTAWAANYSTLRLAQTYSAISAAFLSAAQEFGVQFVDSNPWFRSPETLFVDHVHLNDQGYALASKLVIETMESSCIG